MLHTKPHLVLSKADDPYIPRLDDAAEAADADDNDNHPEHDDAGEPGARPKTRQEMNELRGNFANTTNLVAHLYHDVELKDSLQLVHVAVHPYKLEYSDNLARLSRKSSPTDALAKITVCNNNIIIIIIILSIYNSFI